MHCVQHQKMDGSEVMARTHKHARMIQGPSVQQQIRALLLAGYTDDELIDIGFRAIDLQRSLTAIISVQATERCKYCGAKAIYLDAYKMCMGCRIRRKQK